MLRPFRSPTVPATDFKPGTNVRWPPARFLKPQGDEVDSLPVDNGLRDRVRSRAASQRGFTLIEVLVSALLVMLLAGAVAGGLIANTDFTADQHLRSEADELAQQDQERLKGLSPEQLDDLNQTYTATLDNTKFTVNSQAWYLNGTSGQACSSGANATYFKTISTVTAEDPTNGATQTLATDESVITPPAGGAILARFKDQTLTPLAGVTVSATGPDSAAATSDSTGCTIFTGLLTGSYNLAYTDSGYVDPNGNASLTDTTTVASTGVATPSKGNPTYLGQGGAVTGSFATSYGGSSYTGYADGLSWYSGGGNGIAMSGYRTATSNLASSISTVTASGTPASANGLFPFASSNPTSYTNNYQVWAGTCQQEEPPAGQDMVTVNPGSTQTQVIQEPALGLNITWKGSPVGPSDVKVTFQSASGTSCKDEWGPLAASKVSGNTYVYGIPFASSATSGSTASVSGLTGTVKVCADYKPSGSSTYYQATSSTFTDSFSSTSSETLALTTSSTTGQCT
jgi:prepilin-type N-terminal cleavage/methylation domain-containing protein